MRTRLYIFLCILIAVGAAHVASAKVSINGRTVTTSSFRIVWSSGADVEAISELHWMGGPNLTEAFAIGSCNNGDVEYFGNSWAPPDPMAGGAVLVGGGTTGGVWSPTAAGAVDIKSTSVGCAPSSTGVKVATVYIFQDTAASKNQFGILRQFNFGNTGVARTFRPYIPRFSLGLGFTEVLYPAIGGVLEDMDARSCPYGCTGPLPTPGAAPLNSQWDSSQQWYAIHNPSTGQGVVVMRKRSLGTDGSLIQAQLWIDWDGGSNTNSSSFLLMNPSGGFLGNLSENETFCFYDQNSWTPSMTPPPGCQPTDNSDWPQWGHDAGHTGYNPGERVLSPSNVGTLQSRWALFSSGYYFPNGFAVANGMMYLVGDYGQGAGVYAFDAITGDRQPTWFIGFDNLDSSCLDPKTRLAADKGIVYLACPYWVAYGWVFVINATAGTIEQQGQGDVVFTPADGVLYLTGWQYVAARKLPWDGWITELYMIPTVPYGLAAVDEGVATWNTQTVDYLDWHCIDTSVFSFSAADGSILWRRRFDECGRPGPVARDGVVYAVGDGNLIALDAKDGTQLWSLAGFGTPVLGVGTGYAACGEDLCAFTLGTGKVVWRAPGGGSPVALANGVIYANGAFDAKTGRRVGGVSGIVANGMVYQYFGEGVVTYGLPK